MARRCAAPTEEGVESADPHGFGLRGATAPRAGAGQSGDKSNEIVAIPALLDMMAIEGAIVTIDAMGCQRDIAEKSSIRRPITSSRSKAIKAPCARMSRSSPPSRKPRASRIRRSAAHQTVDGDHGRIETRTYTVIHDVAWLQERHDWPGLKGVVMVESQRENRRRKSSARPASTSPRLVAAEPAGAGDPQPLGDRKQPALGHGHDLPRRRMPHPHRARPRQLHHPQAHGPQPDPQGPRQGLLRLKRKIAAWDDDFLASLIAA